MNIYSSGLRGRIVRCLRHVSQGPEILVVSGDGRCQQLFGNMVASDLGVASQVDRLSAVPGAVGAYIRSRSRIPN